MVKRSLGERSCVVKTAVAGTIVCFELLEILTGPLAIGKQQYFIVFRYHLGYIWKCSRHHMTRTLGRQVDIMKTRLMNHKYLNLNFKNKP